jgi:SpoVK/Ycf46/Vps4 family AAA+-type ATPase
MLSTFDHLRQLFAGNIPVIYMRSAEEQRAERIIKAAQMQSFPGTELFAWTATRGITTGGKKVPDSEDVLKALEFARTYAQAPVIIFKDIHHDILNNKAVVRKLRDIFFELKGKKRFLILLSPIKEIPIELLKEVFYMEMDLPGEEELIGVYEQLMKAAGATLELDEKQQHALGNALRGLSITEAEVACERAAALVKEGGGLAEVLSAIFAEKEQVIRKEGVLDFIPPDASVAGIGGLDNLKDWLKKREKAIRDPNSKMPLPKGILIMGIAGCGKSLTIKTISSMWDIPLFRLDMNRVFGGAVGSPEVAVERAFRMVEQLSPCVLWIDEIEMSFAGYAHKEGGASARIFGNFLTWMQEHKTLVFVAATANRIEMLPAEILRKGRFDQIFFVDLPTEDERQAILTIHITKALADPAKFSMASLIKLTKGYTGAELESCVAAASIDAFAENRAMVDNDLYRSITKTVPLSKTMHEQTKAIRSWARERATLASKAANMEV